MTTRKQPGNKKKPNGPRTFSLCVLSRMGNFNGQYYLYYAMDCPNNMPCAFYYQLPEHPYGDCTLGGDGCYSFRRELGPNKNHVHKKLKRDGVKKKLLPGENPGWDDGVVLAPRAKWTSTPNKFIAKVTNQNGTTIRAKMYVLWREASDELFFCGIEADDAPAQADLRAITDEKVWTADHASEKWAIIVHEATFASRGRGTDDARRARTTARSVRRSKRVK